MSATIREVLDRVAATIGPTFAAEDVDRVAEAMVRAARAETANDEYPNGATMARILGTSKQNIQQRAARGTLLHIADEQGVRYPLWQLVDGAVPAAIGRFTSEAHHRGLNDTSLVQWVEADPERIAQFRAGNLIELAALLPTETVAIARRRVRGPASEITDERPTAQRIQGLSRNFVRADDDNRRGTRRDRSLGILPAG